MIQPTYAAAQPAADRICRLLASHPVGHGLSHQHTAAVPDGSTIAALIDAAFWTSLRREEGYIPRISLAFVAPADVRDAVSFATSLSLEPKDLTKLAPAVERTGLHFGVWPQEDELRVWGITRKLPAFSLVLEVVLPGLLVVKLSPSEEFGKFINLAVLQGDEIKIINRQAELSPAYPPLLALLALGIGATTAIFTLVHQVMLKSLPVSKPEELWAIGDKIRCCNWGGYTQGDDGDFSLFSWEAYKHFRANTSELADLAALQAGNAPLGVRRAGSQAQAETRNGEYVSGNFFRTFGVQPWMGRLMTDADDVEGAPPVAVMSYHVWQDKYASDPSVVGCRLRRVPEPHREVVFGNAIGRMCVWRLHGRATANACDYLAAGGIPLYSLPCVPQSRERCCSAHQSAQVIPPLHPKRRSEFGLSSYGSGYSCSARRS